VVHFARLRLTGFKSFVDPTELSIDPGITGIVGPNGCGKSNLVEALRWAMGETSPKRVRGSEMEDVIFAGTQSRPARNVAEVSLLLDNRHRRLPSQFNDNDELLVTRRIERGQGSAYEVNGRDVRARDVQLLFADAATGAHSTALVSQGRVGALINARPVDRRALLEEAAGITGLHGRRHEAELRLNAAETNLARLDDVIKTLEAQLAALKKQARQAQRYRSVAAQIRRQEALLLHLELTAARAELAAAEQALERAEAQVVQETEALAVATTAEAEASEALPPLRLAEAEAGARLQRLSLDRESLARELAKVQAQLAETEARLAQSELDRARTAAQQRDAEAAEAELAAELRVLAETAPAAEAATAEARAALAAAEAATEGAEQRLASLAQALATAEAEAEALARRRRELAERRQRLLRQREETLAEQGRLQSRRAASGGLAEAEAARVAADAALAAARPAAEQSEAAFDAARAEEATLRQRLNELEREHGRLEAEVAALAALAEPAEASRWPAVVEAVRVEPGFEAALGAALGDDLSAPGAEAEAAAPLRWQALPELAAPPLLPAGVVSLALYLRAPAVLARRLWQIGLVRDRAAGRLLQPLLQPGQRLVTRAGDLWRWDGFVRQAEAATAAGQRLQQRNRLAELRRALEQRAPALEQARAALGQGVAALGAVEGEERIARQTVSQAFRRANEAREAEAAAVRQAQQMESRLATLSEILDRLQESEAELGEAERAAAEEAAAAPDLGERRAEVGEARALLAEERQSLAASRVALEALLRQAEVARQRGQAIERERGSWQRRAAEAERFQAELQERALRLAEERQRLAAEPAAIAERQQELARLIEEATLARRDAGDRLAAAEEAQRAAQQRLKAASATLAATREARVRAEGGCETCRQVLSGLSARIEERVGCRPDQLVEAAEIDPGMELPERAEIEAKLQRLIRERENIGPVNLRAEHEAGELETRLGVMVGERTDLVAAIARLRQGIASLNREGRERLLAAFEQVNRHFGDLFLRLFGGGRAHLALTEAEDPLEAGLEIMASPPGKRLTVLSLLSGGEQALTALALLFAVFLTNPAPICVLDEVDAPLDDANVDRFCSLVDELAAETQTRFLIITHHRLTMARVDRLYGVTMAERGISQLVSVDLQQAEQMRESA